MDLRSRYPRSMREKLAGYIHLARMIDKARAKLAGMLGGYIYPCPLDRRLLEFAGLTADQFLQAVKDRADEAVVDWFLTTAMPRSSSEIEAWNNMMLSLGPDNEETWAYFRKTRDAIDPGRTDITTWADLLDLDEKRSVPIRKATI
ncbi:MAG: DUF5069 domain-containing protein [Nitrospiraceae bacterium]